LEITSSRHLCFIFGCTQRLKAYREVQKRSARRMGPKVLPLIPMARGKETSAPKALCVKGHGCVEMKVAVKVLGISPEDTWGWNEKNHRRNR
jgi:hypothetical protein